MSNATVVLVIILLIISGAFFYPKKKLISSKAIGFEESAEPRHIGFMKKEIFPDIVVYTCYGIFF